MEEPNQLEVLFKKYLDRDCSEEEIRRLVAYFNVPENEEALKKAILVYFEHKDEEVSRDPVTEAQALAEIHENLMTEIGQPVRVLPKRWYKYAAAASILVFLGVGAYFVVHNRQVQQVALNDVQPYSRQAVIKTGHGRVLRLDSTKKGLLAQYAGLNINTVNNTVSYNSEQVPQEKVVYDTLQVPAGGKPYEVKLADGSSVTVNVASSLRFPEGFRGNAADLQLIEGEAYFDIKHDLSHPITVKAKDQTIADVGTGFNIKTYNNEPASRTTLVEGHIKVNDHSLQPGQQALVMASNLTIVKANLVEVLAWKDGYFRFNGENIQTVMRELARWYNIEVVYEGKITEVGFFTRVSRSKNISEVLKVLEHTTNTVHFKIEGRRVIVLGKKTT